MFQYVLLDPRVCDASRSVASHPFIRRLINIVLASASVFAVVGAAALAIRIVLL